MRMQLTKMDKARVIVTALYNLKKLVTEEKQLQWKAVKRIARQSTENLDPLYETAKRVLESRLDK